MTPLFISYIAFKNAIQPLCLLRNKSIHTTLYIGITNDIQRRISQHYFDSQNAKKSFQVNTNAIIVANVGVFHQH